MSFCFFYSQFHINQGSMVCPLFTWNSNVTGCPEFYLAFFALPCSLLGSPSFEMPKSCPILTRGRPGDGEQEGMLSSDRRVSNKVSPWGHREKKVLVGQEKKTLNRNSHLSIRTSHTCSFSEGPVNRNHFGPLNQSGQRKHNRFLSVWFQGYVGTMDHRGFVSFLKI